ncbi:hypothetical protein [Flavobacterium mesophilum]|uniref:hypothetical protein n=1 Tax=Flavobacterium mesophilum TaxID=3143495 RepID=UPI0031CE892F
MSTLALMEAASFCAGVQYKRYSGQQESAPGKSYAFLRGLYLKGFVFKKKLI